MNLLSRVFLICLLAAFFPACSAYKASTQPDKKDLSLLTVGTPRAVLIAEFGAPIHSEIIEGQRQDIFRFVQGYSNLAKSGRALGHGAASVLTLGIWEVVGTPIEGAFDGNQQGYLVEYDGSNLVTNVTRLITE